ncbi:MAG: hypothetical protein OXN89_02460 [Bryobacterales bacterium]|nr:hypothetical protein [Bryobacterales bacterium]
MPEGLARNLWVGGACAAAPVALVLGVIALLDAEPSAPVPPGVGTLHTVARVVATLEGPVRLTRPGRVLSLHVRPGQAVGAGDPVADVEDLALRRSIDALEKQVGELEKRHDGDAGARSEEPLRAEMDLRAAVVRQLERAHSRASEEMARWNEMKAEGLVARLDYERKRSEFEDLEGRLENARRQAASPPPASPSAGSPESDRSRRLLERLKSLPSSYPLTSSWDGTVSSVLVEPGQTAPGGTVVATISRSALARLETEVEPGAAVLAVLSACGVPGPLPFEMREGTLGLICPAAGVRPGDTCKVALSVRE